MRPSWHELDISWPNPYVEHKHTYTREFVGRVTFQSSLPYNRSRFFFTLFSTVGTENTKLEKTRISRNVELARLITIFCQNRRLVTRANLEMAIWGGFGWKKASYCEMTLRWRVVTSLRDSLTLLELFAICQGLGRLGFGGIKLQKF